MPRYESKHVEDDEEDEELEEIDDEESTDDEDEDNEEEIGYEVRTFLVRHDQDRRHCP